MICVQRGQSRSDWWCHDHLCLGRTVYDRLVVVMVICVQEGWSMTNGWWLRLSVQGEESMTDCSRLRSPLSRENNL